MAFPVAKSLSRAGHAVFAGVSIYSNYLEWSRYISGSFVHPSLEPGDDLAMPHILAWLETHTVDFIQPVSEAGIRFLNRHRERFQAHGKLIMPSKATVETASNKPEMFALCDRLKLPLAAHATVTSMAELGKAIKSIGFPVIVKPATIDAPLHGRKALIVHSAEALQAKFPHWPDDHPDLIVQRFVSGPRHSVVFSAQAGRLIGAVEVCAARTHEADGTGYTTYGVTVSPTPAVKVTTEALVEALNYDTTGCTQFIVDPVSGEITFMELNPRVSLTRIAVCAGFDHPALGPQIAAGDVIEASADPWDYPAGVEYVWSKGDLMLAAESFRQGQASLLDTSHRVARIGWDALRCHHAIFDASDPMPSLGVYGNKLISPIRQRLGRNDLAQNYSAA